MSVPPDPNDEATRSQNQAADPRYSVFVTANAGSGKTKVLVDRIARLLLQNTKPSAFLCITYTKAAAAEMQRRLFERLGCWCVADDVTLAAELAKLGAAGADLGRARALFAQALESPGGLKIQTIHAFCERLLARFPLEAGVPPGFDIADEPRTAALLGQARADAALAPDAPRAAFRRFAAKLHGEGLEGLLDRLALRRSEFRRFSVLRQGQIFAEQALRDRHGVTQTAEDFIAAFLARIDWAALRRAKETLNASTANNIKTGARIDAALRAYDAAAPRTEIAALAFRIALKEDGAAYSNLATDKLARAEPWLATALDAFSANAVAARERLNAIERAEDAIAALALALKLDQAYADAKSRAGVLDFDDLIAFAQALLQRSDAAPWVLYKLDGGLDHILIDEGQDTSPVQWDLITPLQEEFFAGAGARATPRTVFAVGDPKQSIYGFQGADPERFLAESQRLSTRVHAADMDFRAPDLRTSFRSSPEILRAVDASMKGKPLIAGPGARDEIVHLASRADQGGVVEVWPWTPRPLVGDPAPWDAPIDAETGVSVHAQLAKAIAARVKSMIETREAVWDADKQTKRAFLRPIRPGDVLALVRTRGAMFRELIKAFKRAGLPVAGADRMVLRDELAVEDCLALMRVALDPADDLSLACVLKGPWCNLTNDDADLLPLAYGRARGERLIDRLLASTEQKYAAARAFVHELAARKGADAFSFLSWALESSHGAGPSGWARVFARLGPETHDPLEELLQRALKPAHHVAPTLQRFLYDIEIDAGQVKRELEAETGAIRVMTVHGAKGLEAPFVILPDATGDVGDAPDNGLIFDDDKGPYVSFRGKDDDLAVAGARTAHKQRMLGEHWRLLYVAMTRARDRLLVCGPQFRSSEDRESWRAAVEAALDGLGAGEIETPFGPGRRLGAPQIADAHAAPDAPHIIAPSWLHVLAPASASPKRAAPSRATAIDPSLFSPHGDGQKRFRRGRLIHGLLQRLPEAPDDQRAEVASAWLKRHGADASEAGALAQEALRVIAQFPLLYGPASRAEAPIVGEALGFKVSGIVDRLAVDAQSVIVLDYKTDRPAPASAERVSEAYLLQMAFYRAVLRSVFPGRTIACALLWTEAPLLMNLPDALLDDALAGFRAG